MWNLSKLLELIQRVTVSQELELGTFSEADSEIDRNQVISKPEKIEAWTGFDFKGRNGQYSSMKWNKAHFTGTDYDHKSRKNAVWLFDGKEWAHDVDEELGNYDYLYPSPAFTSIAASKR